MDKKYYHPDHDFIRKLGAAPPTATPHGTDAEISENLKKLMPNSWRMEGNQLIGQTDMGPLVQFIDPAYILTGTDARGLPVFEKVIL
jgi:hypothetical protein